MTLTDAQMRERMAKGWRMGAPFTACGNGSLPRNTANIRSKLPGLLDNYGITVVNDAGCGDLMWRHGMRWGGEFVNFDLFPRAPGVMAWDITTEAMPPADAILARMVLNHLQERVEQTLLLFRESAPVLIATQFDGGGPQRDVQFNRLDLREWLGEPIVRLTDGSEPGCSLAMFEL